MKLTLAVLSVVILSVGTQHVEEQGNEYNQVPIILSPGVFRYPQQQQQLPYYNDPRLGLTSLLNLMIATSTTTAATTTVSSTTTCLKPATACTGRRRRWIEWPEDEGSIAPSAITKIETTQQADLESIRETREADSQFLMAAAPYHGFQQSGYVLQPTFGGQYQYNYPQIPYSYYGGYPHGAQQQVPANVRWGWTVTSTVTPTSTSVITFTSTVVCIFPGTTIPQCPP